MVVGEFCIVLGAWRWKNNEKSTLKLLCVVFKVKTKKKDIYVYFFIIKYKNYIHVDINSDSLPYAPPSPP